MRRSVDRKMKKREAELREMAREETMMRIAQVEKEAATAKEAMSKKAASAKMKGFMSELGRQGAESAKKAAEASWKEEKTYTMEMEDKIRELTSSLADAEAQGARERAAAAKKVSEANVKVGGVSTLQLV